MTITVPEWLITVPEWLLWLLGVPLALIWAIAGGIGVWMLWQLLTKGIGGWR